MYSLAGELVSAGKKVLTTTKIFMPPTESKITGIILAAGLSRRLGTVKSLLPWGKSYSGSSFHL